MPAIPPMGDLPDEWEASVAIPRLPPRRVVARVCPVYRARRWASSCRDHRRLRRGTQARHHLPWKDGAPVGILPGRRRDPWTRHRGGATSRCGIYPGSSSGSRPVGAPPCPGDRESLGARAGGVATGGAGIAFNAPVGGSSRGSAPSWSAWSPSATAATSCLNGVALLTVPYGVRPTQLIPSPAGFRPARHRGVCT